MGASLGLGLAGGLVAACSSDEFQATDAGGDAPSEASALEAGPDAPSPGFCASHPKATLCDDFETEWDSASGFRTDYTVINLFANTTRGKDAFDSGFGAKTSSLASGDAGASGLLQFDPNKIFAKQLHFQAMVKVEPGCALPGTTLAIVRGAIAGTPTVFGVGVGPSSDATYPGFYVVQPGKDGGAPNAVGGAGGVPVRYGAWVPLDLQVTFDVPNPDAGNGKVGTRVVLTWDGQPAIDYLGAEGASSLATPLLQYGQTASARPTACTVAFDDVVFDVAP